MKHIDLISQNRPLLADDGSSFWSHMFYGLGNFLNGLSDLVSIIVNMPVWDDKKEY
jgi:hypothetical protein